MPILLQLEKITVERGWRVNKKCLYVVFGLIRRSRVRRKKCVLGHPKARATSYCLLPAHYDYVPQKMRLTLAV